MQALWINKFDFNGNTAAIITWAEGVLQTGRRLHLVLTGVPPFLLPLYQKYLAKTGLKSSLNINRQQIQNLLFYRGFDLLHVFHPDLFLMAAELSRSFQIPWIAGYLSGEDHPGLTCVHEADTVTCSHSDAFQTLQRFFNPYRKTPLHLIPPGVKTGPPPDFSPPQQWSVLYAGPLENRQLAPFLSLNEVIRSLDSWTCGVFSRQKPPRFSGNFHPWTPAFSKIIKDYTIIAGHGYFLLQALAAGKIALLLEERYAGIFSPLSRREQVPALRAKLPVVKTGPAEDTDPRELLCRDLQMLCTDRAAKEKLQRDGWSYTRENHDIEIVAEKIRRLYSRLNKTAR
ncbi:MAG: hypothetical protein ACOX1X_08765 [Dethiobacteria bacterium]